VYSDQPQDEPVEAEIVDDWPETVKPGEGKPR
jgi:hypothetical protein